MARPTRTLIGMITDQATKTYEGDSIDRNNFEQWEDHWFATADLIREKFDAEGLTETTAKIEDIIEDQRRISNGFKEREARRKDRIWSIVE